MPCAASSAAMSHLRQSTEPKAIDPETSITISTVRSRSESAGAGIGQGSRMASKMDRREDTSGNSRKCPPNESPEPSTRNEVSTQKA